MKSEVILGIGTSKFPDLLFQDLHRVVNLRQLVAYRYRLGAPVEMLFAESANEQSAMQSAIAAYSRHYHSRDPLLTKYTPFEERGTSMYHVEAHAIPDEDFRDVFYRQQTMGSKTAIVVQRPQDVIVLNLFRGEQAGEFSGRQWGYLDDTKELIAAAVERHCDLTHASQNVDWRGMLEALTDLPRLSRQEAAVCAYILDGCFNEGISLNMGISVHSVITYRRRAFAKLGITSQCELYGLLVKRRLH